MLNRTLIGQMLFAGFLGLCATAPARSAPVEYITSQDTWKYINTEAATTGIDPTGFQMPAYDDSGWFTGQAAFGNAAIDGIAPNTNWTAHYDPFVRKTVNLASPVDMVVELALDNGYDLFINGVSVSSANAEGFTTRWEYTFNVPASFFVAGANTIALALEDHGGATAFDMRMTGPEAAAIPEPATTAYALVSAAPFLFQGLRRRVRG